MSATPPGSADDQPTLTRPASLWPETTRAGGGPSTGFTMSHFDPRTGQARPEAQAVAAFDVCHPALALRALLLVQLALALVALAGADEAATWLSRQAVLAFGGAAATGVWLVTLCALRSVLGALPAAGRATGVLALGAVAALLAWAPLALLGLVRGGAWQLAAVGLGGVALAGVLAAWLELRSRIWQPANASARLAELQSRIRPHFLFNALNTALALVRVDPERAEAVLEDLSALFRVALAEVGESVTLDEEIDLARRYLAIEQIRFGKRLRVHWDIEPRSTGARVPPLVLQPLVENAVRHGIEPARRGGEVRVRSVLQRGQVVVTVTNTLGDEPSLPGHGMALHNVRERLRLLHDVGAQCDVWREPGPDGADLFHARIVLPAP